MLLEAPKTRSWSWNIRGAEGAGRPSQLDCKVSNCCVSLPRYVICYSVDHLRYIDLLLRSRASLQMLFPTTPASFLSPMATYRSLGRSYIRMRLPLTRWEVLKACSTPWTAHTVPQPAEIRQNHHPNAVLLPVAISSILSPYPGHSPKRVTRPPTCSANATNSGRWVRWVSRY